jgi:hypothetical protein
MNEPTLPPDEGLHESLLAAIERLSSGVDDVDGAWQEVTKRVRRAQSRRRARRGAVAVLIVGALFSGTAIAIDAFSREQSVRLKAGAAESPFPEVRSFVAPKDASDPPFVSAPLRAVTLTYSIGAEGSERGSVRVQPPALYETTYDANGDWVERSVGATASVVEEYRNGERTLTRDGQLISRVTIDPQSRPYQPLMELTRYGAAFPAHQETLQNKHAKVASERVSGVKCGAAAPCIEVVYTRIRVLSAKELDTDPNYWDRVGDNAEDATLVYDSQTKLVRYYRLRVNGHVTHEFKLVEVRPAATDWLFTTPQQSRPRDPNAPPPPTRIPAPQAVTTPNGPRATALAQKLKTVPQFAPLQLQSADDLDYSGELQTRLTFGESSGGLVKVNGFRLTEPISIRLLGAAQKQTFTNGYVAGLNDGATFTATQLFLVAPDGSVINISSDPRYSHPGYQPPALSADDLRQIGTALAAREAR